MKQAILWIEATRPKAFTIPLAPIAMAGALAYSQGSFDLLLWLNTLATAIAIQVTSHFANDYFDKPCNKDGPARVSPKRITNSGLVSTSVVGKATCLAFLTALLLGAGLVLKGGVGVAVVLAFSLLAAIGYSAGRFSLARTGLDDISVLIFYGVIATAGSYYLQTDSLTLLSLFIGMAPGLLANVIQMLNNLRDCEEDAKVGRRSFPVRFGKEATKKAILICYSLVAMITLILCWRRPTMLLALAALIPCVPLLKSLKSAETAQQVAPLFFQAAKLPLLYGLLFSVAWLLG